MITVIDLNLGNVASVANALKFLKVAYKITADLAEIKAAEKIIFPGVGNFTEAAKRLSSSGIDTLLREKVLMEKVPILGICLGMHLLASYGEEGGGAPGLDLIKGKVLLHRAKEHNLRLPHIGWNDVTFDENFKLFKSIAKVSCFYFVHSFELIIEEEKKVNIACSNYGEDFVAAFQKEHIMGTQFHPEKSQEVGLGLLKNFCEGNF